VWLLPRSARCNQKALLVDYEPASNAANIVYRHLPNINLVAVTRRSGAIGSIESIKAAIIKVLDASSWLATLPHALHAQRRHPVTISITRI
jgi:hypothetical protein